MRAIWAFLGLAVLALGIIGIVLPLLPTVPFLLLAAFFFARSSETLHTWLLDHPKLGPPIQDWNERGSISKRAKTYATMSIAAALFLSVYLALNPLILAIQAVCLGCVLLFIWTRPNA